MAGVYGNMMISPNSRGGKETGRSGGPLPEYRGEGGVYVPGQGINGRMSDEAGRVVGRAGEDRGRQLISLSEKGYYALDKVTDAYDRYSRTKATQFLNEYHRQMSDLMYGDSGLMRRKGENASTITEEYNRVSQELQKKILGDFEGSLPGEYFKMRVADYDTENGIKLKTHSGREFDDWAAQENKAAADMYAREAANNYSDPESFRKNLAQAAWHLKEMLKAQGVGADAQANEVQKLYERTYDSAMKTALDRADYEGARGVMARAAQIIPEEFSGGQGQGQQVQGQGQGQKSPYGRNELMGEFFPAPSAEEITPPGASREGYERARKYKARQGYLYEHNVAANNPGDIKLKDGGFVAYKTWQDGLIAIAEKWHRWRNNPGNYSREYSKGSDTYRPFRGTAYDYEHISGPESDNNDTVGNAKKIMAALGLPEEDYNKTVLDIDNPEVMAKIIKTAVSIEGTVRISDEEAMQAAMAYHGGRRAVSVGKAYTPPSQMRGTGYVAAAGKGMAGTRGENIARYQKQLENSIVQEIGRKVAAGQMDEANTLTQKALNEGYVQDPGLRAQLESQQPVYDALKDLQETEEMPPEQRELLLLSNAEKYPSGPAREAYITQVHRELQYQKTIRDSKEGVLMNNAINELSAMSPAAAQKSFENMKASGKYSPIVLKKIEAYVGKKKEPPVKLQREETEKMIADWKERVDRQYAATGKIDNDFSEPGAWLKEGKITNDQFNDCVDYKKRGGALQPVNQTKMNRLWLQLTGQKTCPQIIMQLTWGEFGSNLMGKGRVPSDDEIKQYLANLVTVADPGYVFGLFGKRTEGEVQYNTLVNEAPPGMPPQMLRPVQAIMRKNGATEEDVRDKEKVLRAYCKINGIGKEETERMVRLLKNE